MSIHAEPVPGDLSEQTPSVSSTGPSFLAQLLDAVQHSIIAVDRDECITFWNQYATRLYGYTPEEVIGRNIGEVTATSPSDPAARAIMDSVWNGQPWCGEYPVHHRNGSSVPARVRLFPILDATRNTIGIVGVSEDISEEIAARRTLQLTQKRFELLTRSNSDAVWDWDVASDSLWANEAFTALAGPPIPGLSAAESWLARIHPADRPAIQDRIRRLDSAGESFRNEYRFLSHATNQYVQIADRGFLVRDPAGHLLRVVGAMTDVSHISDIEQAFRASEERFRLVFEESPLGIVIIDPSFHILQSNAAYRRMLGYSQEELLGHYLVDITHPDDQPGCLQLLRDLFAAECSVFRVEKRYVRRDGSTVWAAVTATLLPARTDSPTLGLGLIEDITEQRRVREELTAAKAKAEAAMGAKMRFLAQISHEIRSPMNGVLGMLELLEASPLSQDQLDNLTAARQAATSLLGMLEDILDLTRIDQKRLALHPRPYSPVQLANDLTALFRVKAASKNVRLSTITSPAVPSEHVADPNRIRQILINLLDNALKFTSHGQVQLSLSATPATLSFTVTDSGIGIPPESLASVFESFSAISAQTSASVGGTGLGLAISQRLARIMGGDISAASQLGEGSTFTLTLPRSANSPLPLAAPPALPEPPSFPGRRILVAEDNHINQRVAAGILRRLDCQVDLAGNGVEALQMALQSRYDAIIMDAMMPVMDGFEATAEIRRREPAGSRVPIIGLTALATEEDRLRCLNAGMDDYLPKPADFHTLSSVVSRWL